MCADKVTLQSVTNVDNTLIAAINNNNAAITAAIDNTLSRNGQLPNQMTSSLDMNNNPILNIPNAFTATMPVALGQLTNLNNIPVSYPTMTGDVTGTVNNTTGQIPTTLQAISGDMSNGGTGRVITLNTVNANVGSFGAANAIPVITENAKGLTTAVTTVQPNPTQVNSVTYPASPSTNTVPVVTGTNAITYEQVPGAAIAASTVANSNLTTMANQTIKSNISGATANPSDNTLTSIIDNAFGSTQGSILYRGASAWATLGPGSNTQVLTSQGAGANPAWSNPAAGRVLLNTLSPSNVASINDQSSITSTYKQYDIYLENVVPVTNSTNLELQLYITSVLQTTSYICSALIFLSAGTAVNTPTTYLQLCSTNVSMATNSSGVTGLITLWNPSNTTTKKIVRANTGYSTASSVEGSQMVGFYNGGTGAITGVNFLFSSGNISSGTIYIYGVP